MPMKKPNWTYLRERRKAREEYFVATAVIIPILWEIPQRFVPYNTTGHYDTCNQKREYDAKIDSKKRLTIRGARTRHYHVTEYEDGTVELSPRELIHPDEISRRTLQMMDRAMDHLQKGEVSDPVDVEALQELLE